ncbi:MAG TPA: adenine phosphoribosyltransferase [Cyclobacteriaceae bacterium]|nr:adenine phosphoribosyltransferase [Cyclobacteriaceae bacterium]
MTLSDKLKSLLRDVPDFPKPGVLFKDITPLLANPETRTEVVDAIANHFLPLKPDALAAVEARGFIFGMLIADRLGIPFVPVRKAGKLPFRKVRQEYSLEYGKAEIEMHEDAVLKGAKVIIHDDLLATGGTAGAAGKLIQHLGGIVAGYSFLINLSFLPGERRLQEEFGVRPHYLVSF